jgi:Mycothiol maleylpyruvate isomerase N-terminal domain
MNPTRMAYVEAATIAAELVALPDVAAKWDDPGTSRGMTVGGIAVHLVGSGIEMLVSCLLEEEPPGTRTLEPSRYFSGQSLDLDHEGHEDVRERARSGSQRGAASLASDAASAVSGLAVSLAEQGESRRVLVLGKFDMTLDGFLITRLVELLAHADDLAASISIPTPDMPAKAYDLVIPCLTDVARRRHGDLAVLRALARRERSIDEVFPVF